MLDRLAVWIINTYIGEYVENLNTDQLSIGILRGAVELDNLPLRKDALRKLDLPLAVKSGFLGKFKLKVPLTRSSNSSWEVYIDKLYLVAGPHSGDESYSVDEEMEFENLRKRKQLDLMENQWKANLNADEPVSWWSAATSFASSFVSNSMLTNIIEDLQVVISDVHIRYEGPSMNNDRPIAFGVTISSLKVQAAKKQDQIADKDPLIVKSVVLNSFAIYCDSDTDLYGDLPIIELKDVLQVNRSANNDTKHDYVLEPMYAVTKLSKNRSEMPLKSRSNPRYTLDTELDKISLTLSSHQLQHLVYTLDEVERSSISRKYRQWRPKIPITRNSTKKWWSFAISVTLNDIRERHYKHTRTYITNRISDILLYVKVYKQRLTETKADNYIEEEILRIENDMNVSEIVILREIVMKKILAEKLLQKEIETAADQDEKSSMVSRWFPGWASWGTGSEKQLQVSKNEIESASTQAISDLSAKDPIKVRADITEFEEELFNSFTGSSNDGGVLKRDLIFASVNFCLRSGSILFVDATCSASGSKSSYEPIASFDLSKVTANTTLSLRTDFINFKMSLGSLLIKDMITKGSLLPNLVSPSLKSKKSSDIEDIFFLQFEQNPLESKEDYRLQIRSQPLAIIYNSVAVSRFVEIFNIKQTSRSEIIANAARSRYENLKKQTKEELRHTFDQILHGFTKTKKWGIYLDISAPQIILPENVTNPKASLVILDFGHLLFHNIDNPAYTEIESEKGSFKLSTVNDAFQTPPSTPSSDDDSNDEIFASAITYDRHTSSISNAMHDKLYESFNLSMRDLQVSVSQLGSDCKKSLMEQFSGSYLIDKFSISLSMERRLYQTTDPQWPSATLSGTLPALKVHLNEEKFSTFVTCIRALTNAEDTEAPTLTSTEKLSPEALAVSMNRVPDEDFSESTYDERKPAEADVEQVKRKVLAESKLLLVEFQIETIDVVVSSRGRTIAEVEVAGVKANYTKCPYDVSISLSVQLLSVYDRLQLYGPEFKTFITSKITSFNTKNEDQQNPKECFDDSRTLISVDYQAIDGNCPTEGIPMEGLRIASIHFNTLEVTANQELLVELMAFLDRISTDIKTSNRQKTDQEISNDDVINVLSSNKVEIIADCHSLSVVLVRSIQLENNVTIGRKVAVVIMNSARTSATIGKELTIDGAIGGLTCIDLTDARSYRTAFLLGSCLEEFYFSKPSVDLAGFDILLCDLRSEDSFDDSSKALSFKIAKIDEIGNDDDRDLASEGEIANQIITNNVTITMRMGSARYVHRSSFVSELNSCLGEFQAYTENLGRSLRSAATGVARNIVSEKGMLSSEFDLSSDTISTLLEKNHHHDPSVPMQGTNVDSMPANITKLSVKLDAVIQSPVIIFPRSTIDHEALIARLGKISIRNEALFNETMRESNQTVGERILFQIENVSLYALYRNVDSGLTINRTATGEMHDRVYDILKNTTIRFIIDRYFSPSGMNLIGKNTSDTPPHLRISGEIVNALQIAINTQVYDHIKETMHDLTKELATKKTTDLSLNDTNSNEDFNTTSSLLIEDANNKLTLEAVFSIPCLSVTLFEEVTGNDRGLVSISLEDFSMSANRKSIDAVYLEIKLYKLQIEDLMAPSNSINKYVAKSLSARNSLDYEEGYMEDMLYNDSRHIAEHQSLDAHTEGSALVTICITIVNKSSDAFYSKFNCTKRLVDVKFNALNVVLNLETCIRLLDFFRSRSKAGSIESSNPRKTIQEAISSSPSNQSLETTTDNEVIKFQVRSLVLRLSKNDYQLAKACVSDLSTEIALNCGNTSIRCRLGSISLLDLSPYATRYTERFTTIGREALSFEFFKYGSEDPDCNRDCDMKLKLLISSMRYVYTRRFQAELVSFFDHFAHMEDVIKRMREATEEGWLSGNELQRKSRILMNIQMGNPVIILPRNEDSLELIVADLGHLFVTNCIWHPLRKEKSQSSLHASINDESSILNEFYIEDKISDCVLDCIKINIKDMDLYSAVRIESPDNVLHFDCDGGRYLKDKCALNLKVIRNLDFYSRYDVPESIITGSLSTAYFTLSSLQFKLLMGVVKENLSENIHEITETKSNTSVANAREVANNVQANTTVCTLAHVEISLLNVRVEFLKSVTDNNNSVSLALFELVDSCIICDTYSDDSLNFELACQAIIANDTRPQGGNIFNKILQPYPNKYADEVNTVQAELNYRKTRNATKILIIFNAVRIICVLDWFNQLRSFFDTGEDNADEISESDEDSVTAGASLFTDDLLGTPVLSMGTGIFTRRVAMNLGDTKPTEIKFNLTETEVIVVEDTLCPDTNAVILKGTAVLKFCPHLVSERPLSCSLQGLEIFSCNMSDIDGSALSIVDPFQLLIELSSANELSSKASGLIDATKEQLPTLELSASPSLNMHVSYQDVQLFLAIFNSLSRVKFDSEDTKRSKPIRKKLSKTSDNIDAHLEIKDKQSSGKFKDDTDVKGDSMNNESSAQVKSEPDIAGIKVRVPYLLICAIDDCGDHDVPLFEFSITDLIISHDVQSRKGSYSRGNLRVDHYNRNVSSWEPVIETWAYNIQWNKKRSTEYSELDRLCIKIDADHRIDFNVTSPLLETIKTTRTTWADEYNKLLSNMKNEATVAASLPLHIKENRTRAPYIPYVLCNRTGCHLQFATIINTPLSFTNTSANYSHSGVIKKKLSYDQPHELKWIEASVDEDIPFTFEHREKFRHSHTHVGTVHQIVVQVSGWQRMSPVTVDRVGIFFRHVSPQLYQNGSSMEPASARVVFDVSVLGAKKIIVIRSALQLKNLMHLPMQVFFKTPNYVGFKGSLELPPLEPGVTTSIPLQYCMHDLYAQPYGWGTTYPADNIIWHLVRKDEPVCNRLYECKCQDGSSSFWFCAKISRENYPRGYVTLKSLEKKQRHIQQPAHTISFMPVVVIANLLPCRMKFTLGNLNGTAEVGKEKPLYEINPLTAMEFGATIEGFEQYSYSITIPPGCRTGTGRLTLIDCCQRPLILIIKLSLVNNATIKISVHCNYWFVNKSGIPLVFKQHHAEDEAAGQFHEHEIARNVEPLLFSFSDIEANNLCSMRIGKKYDRGKPVWGQRFSPEASGYLSVHSIQSGGRPDQVYEIGINSRLGLGRYSDTRIVTFTCRYQLENRTQHKLAYAQQHISQNAKASNPNGTLLALPGCVTLFHWPRLDRDQLLTIRIEDIVGCRWSGGFRIDRIDSFQICMRDENEKPLFLRVEVVQNNASIRVLFSEATQLLPPYRVDNMAELPIHFYQSSREDLVTTVMPHSKVPYAIDEPMQKAEMVISVPTGSEERINLQKIGEEHRLYYDNCIYLAAIKTLTSNTSDVKTAASRNADKINLVLDVPIPGSTNVYFASKQPGRKLQLWRMTSAGILCNEGSVSMRKKSTGVNVGLVLDAQENLSKNCFELFLNRLDDRRADTQTWHFTENGQLACRLPGLVVQAYGGPSQLRHGSQGVLDLAIDGKTELNKASKLSEDQAIRPVKVRPGSGMLSIVLTNEGPTSVVRISEFPIQLHRIKTMQHEDDKEMKGVTEDALDRVDKSNVSGNDTVTKGEFELHLFLAGGIGISMVTAVPEELLFLSLTGIEVSYVHTAANHTTEVNIQHIQVDNQLENASHPIALYVTPPTSNDSELCRQPALRLTIVTVPSDYENVHNIQRLLFGLKPMTLNLDELLLWKFLQMIGISTPVRHDSFASEAGYDFQGPRYSVTDTIVQYYFDKIRIPKTSVTASVFTASKLSNDLRNLRNQLGLYLIKFENAHIEFSEFYRFHLINESDRIFNDLKRHYLKEVIRQSLRIFGAVDFLGNPIGLYNDLASGISELVNEQDFLGFVSKVTHGISDSTSKIANNISSRLASVDSDFKDKRERIKLEHARGGGSEQFKAGIRGFGAGLSGVTSVFTQSIEGAATKGFSGFISGLGKGIVGSLAKPAAGVLDLAAGTAAYLRDTSSTSDPKLTVRRCRPRRVCIGPGGTLPRYSARDALGQECLQQISDCKNSERYLAFESFAKDSSGEIRALISTRRIYIIKPGPPSEDSVLKAIELRDVISCQYLVKGGSYAIEICCKMEYSRKSGYGSTEEQSSPQFVCSNEDSAQRICRQVNYAKNIYEEEKLSLIKDSDSTEEYEMYYY